MRALILSDIHGNLEALEAVLAAAAPHDAVWNLGDVVGYGASPNEVVDRLRAIATQSVRGNHDKVCCGVSSSVHFNPSAREAALWTERQLWESSMEWLRLLPAGPLDCAGASASISHGSPTDEDLYLANIRDAWLPLQQLRQRSTFFGHTHVQGGFSWRSGHWQEVSPVHRPSEFASQWTLRLENDGTRYLLNPGSIGQPRDGDWRAAFALLDEEASTLTFHRVPYDITLAQGRILMAGLPERLARRLSEGR